MWGGGWIECVWAVCGVSVCVGGGWIECVCGECVCVCVWWGQGAVCVCLCGGTVKLWLSLSSYLHLIKLLTTKSVSDFDDYKILPTKILPRCFLYYHFYHVTWQLGKVCMKFYH